MRSLQVECRKAQDEATASTSQVEVLSERIGHLQKDCNKMEQANQERVNQAVQREKMLSSEIDANRELLETKLAESSQQNARTEGRLDELQSQHTSASAALASDVKALAEEAVAVRQDYTNQLKGLAGELQQRLVSAEAATSQQIGEVQQANSVMEQRIGTELRTTCVSIEKLESDVRSVSTKARQLETGVERQREELMTTINKRGDDASRRLESLSHAVKVFADMAQAMDGSTQH